MQAYTKHLHKVLPSATVLFPSMLYFVMGLTFNIFSPLKNYFQQKQIWRKIPQKIGEDNFDVSAQVRGAARVTKRRLTACALWPVRLTQRLRLRLLSGLLSS